MTTLRIEVARCSGTTVENIIEGLRLAGCMKHIEIDPSEHQFVPYEVLGRALERDGFYVEVRPWPEPPPLPLWRRVRAWPWRAYRWLRRKILGETYTQQYLRDIYKDSVDLSTRDSPLLRVRRRP
jgi:hypothetical protein